LHHYIQGQQGQGQQQRRAAGPGLSDVMTPATIAPLLRSEDVRARLLQHLPEAGWVIENNVSTNDEYPPSGSYCERALDQR